MVHLPPPALHRVQPDRDLSNADDAEQQISEVDALREENAELRTRVIALSKLVIRNVVERER